MPTIKIILDAERNYLNLPQVEGLSSSMDITKTAELYGELGVNNPVYNPARGEYVVFTEMDFLPPAGYQIFLEFELSELARRARINSMDSQEIFSVGRQMSSGNTIVAAAHGYSRINFGLITPTVCCVDVSKPWAATLMCVSN